MIAPAIFALLRHGETEYNRDALLTGQRDVALTDAGILQAQEAGRMLSGRYRFDYVYSSTLSRAFNTAVHVLDHIGGHGHLRLAEGGWNISRHAEIMEQDVGRFTGVSKNAPELSASLRSFEGKPHGGESIRDVMTRVSGFFEQVVRPQLVDGRNVMMVAHAGVAEAFDIYAGLMKPEELGVRHVKNAAPMIYEFEQGRLARHYTL